MAFGRLSSLLFLATVTAGCVLPSSGPPPRFEITPNVDGWNANQSILLIRHGWHTGLAVKPSEISEVDWPESAVFRDAQYVEIGWGDEGFYRARFMEPFVVARAAFLPSRSAIHVTGIHEPLETFFPESQIIEIPVSPTQMRAFCGFIHDSYARDERGGPRYLGPALYGFGGFYQSRGHYFIPNTCNVWTARALAAAGCPIVVPLCTTAPGVVIQAHRFGREIQKRSNVLPVIYPFFNFERPARS